MEYLFDPQLPSGEQPDMRICLFPHLREFLVIDLREGRPRIVPLNASQVLGEEFFGHLEDDFAQLLREESEFPFAHLINLPLRLEEVIRDAAMTAILKWLGVRLDPDELPSVVVYVISGGALAMPSEQVIEGLKNLLKQYDGDPAAAEWEGLLSRLVAQESAAVQEANRQELTEALRGESPDYFSLWESRN